MKVVNRKLLIEFWEKHQQTRRLLQAWLAEVDGALWDEPSQVIDHFPNASELPGSRIKFKIKGGRYRLIIHVNYRRGIVDIRFVGTHEEYDRIDAEKI